MVGIEWGKKAVYLQCDNFDVFARGNQHPSTAQLNYKSGGDCGRSLSTADLEPNGSEKSNAHAVAAATQPDRPPLQPLEVALGVPACPGVTLLRWAAGVGGGPGASPEGCHRPEGLRVLRDLLLLLSAAQKLGHYHEHLSRALIHQAVGRPSGPPCCGHVSVDKGRNRPQRSSKMAYEGATLSYCRVML